MRGEACYREIEVVVMGEYATTTLRGWLVLSPIGYAWSDA